MGVFIDVIDRVAGQPVGQTGVVVRQLQVVPVDAVNLAVILALGAVHDHAGRTGGGTADAQVSLCRQLRHIFLEP